MTTISPLIAGNWKMNGLTPSLAELSELARLLTTGEAPRAVVVVCPPATLLAAVAAQGASSGILAGGQDCHAKSEGAFTGDISASMIADAGAQFVIVGHSERRAGHGETDDMVRAKAEAAIGGGSGPSFAWVKPKPSATPERPSPWWRDNWRRPFPTRPSSTR